MAFFTRGHALIVGVGEYNDPAWRAPITVADAQGVVDALIDPAVSAYPENQIEFLHDQRATLDGVITALNQLAGRVKPTDTVVLFFCGHGLLGTDGLYYFTTQDTVFTADMKVQAGTGLSSPTLIDLLRTIKAKKLVFIINACFSGHVSPSLGPRAQQGVPPSALFGVEVLGTGEGRALITASRPSQRSLYHEDLEHSYFGQALIDGLYGRQGIANSDGYIGLYELYQHLYTHVSKVTNRKQEPVLTILQGVGPFPLAHYPGTTPRSLGEVGLEQILPRDMAVEEIKRELVRLIGNGEQSLNKSRDNISMNQHKLLDFTNSHISGGVKIGDVAGGDMIKITTPTTTTEAASVVDLQGLLKRINSLQADVSRLTEAPKGSRKDAEYALSAAREAGEDNDYPRLREKLESTQKILLDIGIHTPTALPLVQTTGVLLQRAMRL